MDANMNLQNDFVKEHEQAVNEPEAIFLEWLTSMPATEDITFLFFEGEEDPHFYVPWITRVIQNDILSIVCHGKGNVFYIYNKVQEDGRFFGKSLFFVDKDLDDLVQSSSYHMPEGFLKMRGYCTEYYSIENYICSEEALRVIWSTCVHGVPYSKSSFAAKYSKHYSSFVSAMTPFFSACLAAKEAGNKISFGSLNLEKVQIIDVSDIGIVLADGYLSILLDTVKLQADKIDDSLVLTWKRKLGKIHPKKWLRGKYELWFFYQFLRKNLVGVEHKAPNKKGKKKAKLPISLEQKKFFEYLGGRINAPECLLRFLAESYIAPESCAR